MTRDGWIENPFFVLGLPIDAPANAIEREGRRLLAQLEIGLASAARYDTPFGPQTRTPDRVRLAMAALRDPETRLLAELWAAAPSGLPTRAEPEPWTEAMIRLGWGR